MPFAPTLDRRKNDVWLDVLAKARIWRLPEDITPANCSIFLDCNTLQSPIADLCEPPANNVILPKIRPNSKPFYNLSRKIYEWEGPDIYPPHFQPGTPKLTSRYIPTNFQCFDFLQSKIKTVIYLCPFLKSQIFSSPISTSIRALRKMRDLLYPLVSQL